jgi:hypothetical protein
MRSVCLQMPRPRHMPKRKIQSFLVELSSTDWFRFPQPPYRGKKWQVRFIPTRDSIVTVRRNGRPYRPRQIVIRAEDEKTAQRALNLILGALNVVIGDHFFPTFSGPPYHVSTSQIVQNLQHSDLTTVFHRVSLRRQTFRSLA